jgi:hypothetical protein
MTAFWKNLNLLAKGQLFNGGYLVGPQHAAAKTKDLPQRHDVSREPTIGAATRLPHRQIAAFR